MPAIVMAFSSVLVGPFCRRLTTIGAITPRPASGNITGLFGVMPDGEMVEYPIPWVGL